MEIHRFQLECQLNTVSHNQYLSMNCQQEILTHSRKGVKYAKIPLLTKIRLFKTVFQDGQSIKKTARQLSIKYSTAKTLVRKFKDQQAEFDLQAYENETVEHNQSTKEEKRCSYCLISESSSFIKVKEEQVTDLAGEGYFGEKQSRKVDDGKDKNHYRKIEIISNIIKSL